MATRPSTPHRSWIRRCIIILAFLLVGLAIVAGIAIPGWELNLSFIMGGLGLFVGIIQLVLPLPGSPPPVALKNPTPVPAPLPQPSEEQQFFLEQLKQGLPPDVGAIVIFGSHALMGLQVYVEGPSGRSGPAYIAMHPGCTDPVYAAVINHVPPGNYYITVNNMAQIVLQTVKTVQARKVAEVYVQDRQPVSWRR